MRHLLSRAGPGGERFVFAGGFDFALGLAVAVGSGISEIGAGSRCADAKSNAAASNKREVRRKIDMFRAEIILSNPF
jgi:hypothetical protein